MEANKLNHKWIEGKDIEKNSVQILEVAADERGRGK